MGPTLVIVIAILIISLYIFTTIEYIYKNCTRPVDNRTNIRTDGRKYYTSTQGIWTRGLQPHAPRAITGRAFMISKKRRGQPDREKERWIDRHIRLTGPHWGPLGPIVGMNISRHFNPTLEINTNTFPVWVSSVVMRLFVLVTHINININTNINIIWI